MRCVIPFDASLIPGGSSLRRRIRAQMHTKSVVPVRASLTSSRRSRSPRRPRRRLCPVTPCERQPTHSPPPPACAIGMMPRSPNSCTCRRRHRRRRTDGMNHTCLFCANGCPPYPRAHAPLHFKRSILSFVLSFPLLSLVDFCCPPRDTPPLRLAITQATKTSANHAELKSHGNTIMQVQSVLLVGPACG